METQIAFIQHLSHNSYYMTGDLSVTRNGVEVRPSGKDYGVSEHWVAVSFDDGKTFYHIDLRALGILEVVNWDKPNALTLISLISNEDLMEEALRIDINNKHQEKQATLFPL